jgi:hypothetical protein
MNIKFPFRSLLVTGLFLPVAIAVQAAPSPPTGNHDTDWLKDAKFGVFMHLLPGDARQLEQVKAFDAQALAAQLETIGARYFVITLGQNSGFFNSPNATYDRITGYAPGERCSTRDLPLDLVRALAPKAIKLLLYLPCQTPNEDARAQKAFGIRQGAGDQPIDLEFARKWAQVIQEWSDRYGEKVAGWWFDGGYAHVGFDEAIARIYADAAKHGNSKAIATFNPGVQLIRWTKAEDYTAGELNEPFQFVPTSRWVEGSQWHALTFLGSTWAQRDTRYPTEQWAAWVRKVVGREGVVTLDMGPNWNHQAGAIGALAEGQMSQVKAIKAALDEPGAAAGPRRLKRAESFLGIHFDFHAGDDCKSIGKNTTRPMIESVINQVHPDYLQIDCKGHPGLSSYPTKVGHPAPGFVGDPLALWRQVTAEHGVALYMHYSGVWDSEAIRRHPDWAVVNADGSRNGNATSFFGPYADKLMIPQLRELAGVYGVDGAWVDGECWASMPDYSEPALKAFRNETGIATVPRQPGDPYWFEFLQFHREAFRKHLRHYIAEVKSTNPGMQLCSNWAFTDHMPEPVSAPVDWISGDFSPQDSVNSARFSARYMARQGKPWDLMAWSFAHAPGAQGSRQKSAVQLEREAAVVLALGGGFQAYFTQRRDGSVRLEQLPVMAEVAKFCRARQAICHHAEPVPQVALLYSTAAHYRESNGLFPRDLSRLRGTLQALLEGQQSVEIVSEHHLAGRMQDYPLIVVPEGDSLEPRFREELIAYVRGGGNLLLVGPKTAELFGTELRVSLDGPPQAEEHYLAHAGAMAPTKGLTQAVRLKTGVQRFGELHSTSTLSSPSRPAASVARLGQGKIAATYFSFSQGYLSDRSAATRAFLNDLARQLFPDPLVEVTGSSDVDVSVNRIGGRLAVNLVNTAGPHADGNAPILDSIPPVGPLTLTIRTEKKPSQVRLEPGGGPLPFTHHDGKTRLIVPRLDIHSVVVVE